MNKRLLSLGLLLLGATFAKAQQHPLKTIQEVQTVSQQELQNGNDASPLGVNDTVRIRGVVVMDAGLSTLVGGKQIWIQTNDGTPFSGIDVYQPFPSSSTPGDGGTGILSLVEGDSVEVTGKVEEFQGETEFIPINTNPATPIQILGSGITVKSKLIPASDLNDANRNNILTTGERWEGMYIELQNMTVQSVDFFSNGARVSFNIVDGAGNMINVSDRFLAMKLPASGGTFVPPNVGDLITSIKGVIVHSKNIRGYELHPFKRSDIVYGESAPAISGISRNFVVPTSNDQVTISALITDADGVANAKLYFAVGAANNNYVSVPMTANGNIYTATIPAQAEGSFVKFFIEATDASAGSLVSRVPNVPTEAPRFFVVRNNGLEIVDVQYTPFSNGNSGFLDQVVTVTGVVTSSTKDLGSVFIQQEGKSSWAGLMCVGGTQLANVNVGNRVRVTGTIKENFGFTRIEAVTAVDSIGVGTITPLELDVDSFRAYSFTATEPYEGMLVKFKPQGGKPLYVINTNADGPVNNYAEYRVGRDTTDGGNGCRVIAGRVTSTAYSSLNVSYVNDSSWATNSGVMNVPVIVVHVGDSMTSLTGIIDYSFSNMKIIPRNNADFENFSRAVGIGSKQVNKGKVVAYPNPTKTNISFDYILPEGSANVVVKVYDLLGKELRSANANSTTGTVSMNISDLTQGAYIYTVSTSNFGLLNTGRFVVVK